MGDLGAESIDFLDIVFRLEKEFSIKIPRGQMEQRARGDLSEEEFAVNGVLQPAGLEQLMKAMPEVDAAEIKQGLTVRDVPTLFTVMTFVTLVNEQLGEDTVSDSDVAAASLAASALETTREPVPLSRH